MTKIILGGGALGTGWVTLLYTIHSRRKMEVLVIPT